MVLLLTGGRSISGTGRPPPARLASVERRIRSVALGAALAAIAGCGRWEAPPAPTAQVELERVRWSEFRGARLARRVQADQLLVLPRRLGALELTPLSELVLTRPRIEVFEESGRGTPAEPGAAPGTPASPDALLPRGRPALPALGALRRVVAATLVAPTITFVRDGAPVARLEAARGTASVRERDLVLHGVRAEQVPAGRTLTADRAVWLADEGALWIQGDYVLSERGAATRGRGLRIDVQLRGAAP